jgi:hypothetical protein
MAGYIRQDVTNNIADGNVINASDFDNEYNAIEAAFHAATGHTHDGTAAEGAPITKIGPTQDVVASASALTPKTDNTVDLGSASFEFKDLYIDGTANIDSLVADTADINGGTIDGTAIGGASAAAGTFTTATATTGNITTVNATTVDTTNIEVTSLKAKDGTSAGSIADSTGVVTLASSILTTTDINGGSIDGTAIGAASASTGAFTTLAASGAVTLSGGTANGVLYLNGSKVVTSGSALTFDGTNFRNTSGAFEGIDNMTLSALVSSTNATVLTLNSAGTSGTTRFQINGSEQMRLDSTGLGIGTNNPGAKLDIVGATSDQIRVGTATSEHYRIGRNASDGFLDFYGSQTGYQGYRFGGIDGTWATINASGNLGLGVTPSAWGSSERALQIGNTLSLTRGSSSEAVLAYNAFVNSSGSYIYNITTNASRYEQLAGQHKWYTAPSGTAGNPISFTQAMTLDASGNLLVGNTSLWSSERLGITGSSASQRFIYARTTSNGHYLSLGTNGTLQYIEYGNGAGLAFTDGATERARIDSSGNLGLGVTPSASSGGGNFNLSGDILGGSAVTLGTNWYFNGGFKYKATGTASRFYLDSTGGYAWFTAASGTAGDPISFTQAMTLDASGNLLVGGTSVYAATMTSYASASRSAGLGLRNSAGTTAGGIFTAAAGSGGGSTDVFVEAAGYLGFNAGGTTERARIDSSGNLGLGVTPSVGYGKEFTFSADITSNIGGLGTRNLATNNGLVYLSSNTKNTGAFTDAYWLSAAATKYTQNNGVHAWFTAASGTAGNAISFTQAMTLDASGNLGIGTSSPAVPLHVANSGTGLGTVGRFERLNGADSYTLNVNIDPDANVAELRAGGTQMGALTFATNNSERARITSGGDLLVGKTSSTGGTAGIELAPAGQVIATRSGGAAGYFNRLTSDGSLISMNRSNTEVGSISVTTTATAYNTSSDYRLKNITGPITTSGAYIDSLNPVEGTWKADGSTFVGLIAHEVQEASRTTVATGVKDGEEMQGMDYSSAEIIANLIAEVKSLRQRLTAAGI